MATMHLLDDALELADLLRPAWAEISAGIPGSHPRMEGDADGAADGDGDGQAAGDSDGDQGSGDGAADGDGDGPAAGDSDGDQGSEPDWKKMARKHEREAKAARKREADLQAQLRQREDANKTEQQKAIDKAREEGETAAATRYEEARRADRLEIAVTRHASKGITLGEGDKAQTVKFADPDDALLHLERAIARKDVDPDDIFDSEGKVKKDGLSTALAEILEEKPHLRAGADRKDDQKKMPAGDAGAGKGTGAGGQKDLEEMSEEDHLKAIQRR